MNKEIYLSILFQKAFTESFRICPAIEKDKHMTIILTILL